MKAEKWKEKMGRKNDGRERESGGRVRQRRQERMERKEERGRAGGLANGAPTEGAPLVKDEP